MSFKQWFIAKMGIIGQFLSVLFKDVVQKQLALVLPIAAKVVKQISQDSTILTSDAKRQAAIDGIKNELADGQVKIGLSVISLAIELAVQQLKESE